MKVLVDYRHHHHQGQHPEECLFGGGARGAGPLSSRANSYSYYYYRNHPSYRQLAATLGSGFKSRFSNLLALLMRTRNGANERRQLQYHHRSLNCRHRDNKEGGAELSERKSPIRRTFEDRSFKSYCKRPKANG